MASPTSSVADLPAKRASGRVRKQTELYTSSPFGTSKRKRDENDEVDADEDVDMADDDEDDEDEDDDPEDDEPAEEEIREKAKKARKPKSSSAPKKPAQKKPKVNGVTSLPIRGANAKKAPAKKRIPKKAKALDTADAEAAGGLYAELFASGKQIEEVVVGWLKAFEQNESGALADFVNFVLKAAGCDGKVTEHDIEDPDSATSRLQDLQAEHQATEPTDYPFIAKGKNSGAFRLSVTGFIHTFIRSIGAAGLLNSNPELNENIASWLGSMTSATNRSFRHTATACSLVIMTGLCEVAKDLSVKASENQRLSDMEKKKPKQNKERVKSIEQKAKQANADYEKVEELLKEWFEVVFVHRYRDVDPNIRRDCVEALGDWISALPDMYLDGGHLRYVGWLLSDDSAVVRLEVVRQLKRLYSDDSKLVGLKTFTERFRSRMVEIGTSDADISVRVAGLELLDALRQNDLLEPDDIDTIGRLIFHEDIRVRKAISSFFTASVSEIYESKVDDLGGSEALEEALPDVGEDNFDAPSLSWLKYKALAEMLHAYDSEDAIPAKVERNNADGTLILHAAGMASRFTLAVDVLYDGIDDLKEWQALAGYLLFDHSRGRANGVANDATSQLKHESILSQDEEVILLEVIIASVKRSLTDLADKVTGTKSKLNKKQKEELQEEQEEAVRNLTELIPRLLKKFGDVPNTAGAVLRLGAVLGLPSLQGLRQDSTSNAALLDDLRKQFMSHGTDEVLAPATAAILHAQSYGELDDGAMEKLTSLWEDVVGNLAELLDLAKITVRGASQEEELQALSNNLLRIVRLSHVSNCVPPLEDKAVAAKQSSAGKEYNGSIDYIIDLVQRGVNSDGIVPDPDEAALEDLVAARAAEAAIFYFRWKLSGIINAIKTGSTAEIEYDLLVPLAERRDAFLDNLSKVLDSRRASDPICASMAGMILDLYTSAAILRTEKPRPGVPDDYTVLIMDLDTEREKAVMKVFQATEREFAKLSNKKLEDPVSEDAEEDVDADPIDDDPVSDDESDEETQTQTQASQLNRDAKLMKPVIAEERLCKLTTQFVLALLAGVVEDKATRKRLERNKAKLGNNYKEVLSYLDVASKQTKTKGKAKAAPKVNGAAAAKKGKANPKSNAIVAESDHEDEIEDDEAEVEPEPQADEDEEMANGAEEESVIGD